MNNMFLSPKILIATLLLCTTLFAQKQSSLAVNGETKYKSDFKHFEYVNPNAPKQGELKLSSQGTFDSLNNFVLKGSSAEGLNLLFDTLASISQDEPFSLYPLIAEFIEVSPDNSWVKFYINKKAKFQDGTSISAKDVKFSFHTLIEKGTPFYKRYYNDVKDVQVIDNLTVQFNFKRNDNKELALILGQLVVFPEHFWKGKDFLDSDNIVPLGSGPYKIEKYKYGKYITYKRDANYWAKDLPANVGHYNFDRIKYDYYKDEAVALEAFKSGEFDLKIENTAKTWATLYKGKNFDNGKITKKNIPHELAQGMQGFLFNLRKPLFQDIELRRAINLAFDFEWTNKQLFFGQYTRTNSYFANSELSSRGLPSKEELKLLTPFKDKLPSSIFTAEYKNNVTKGNGKLRTQLRQALKILKKQGWKFENKVLVKDGKKLEFEILLTSPAFERIVQPFIKNLKKIGIVAKIKMIEAVSYTNRLNNFDYDMTVQFLPVSLSPGNELYSYWGSNAASIKGSRNYMGLQSSVIDALLKNIVTATSRQELITAVRALDRVLLHNYYVVPQWYNASYRIAYWSKFKQPKISPKYGLGIHTWWEENQVGK